MARQRGTTTEAGGARGFNGGKNSRGRKRQILVATEGKLLTVVVHRAHLPDRDGAAGVREAADDVVPRVEQRWGDQADIGDLADALDASDKLIRDIVAQAADQQGGVVVPRRGVVARPLAWLGRDQLVMWQLR